MSFAGPAVGFASKSLFMVIDGNRVRWFSESGKNSMCDDVVEHINATFLKQSATRMK
jgi:hypothetical protein